MPYFSSAVVFVLDELSDDGGHPRGAHPSSVGDPFPISVTDLAVQTSSEFLQAIS